ncbi:hypothetical protein QBC38DRAFT_461643 [Podospora fimiseda]|uniref:Uncharacterized protein n=1 Tax=Podospora fimiseda TaxID=252190 RepID=A0AAN7BEW8_9PEZI|nr:hypothetical protein QBC38DRAFT_461643 [Podospora fimiseda]
MASPIVGHFYDFPADTASAILDIVEHPDGDKCSNDSIVKAAWLNIPSDDYFPKRPCTESKAKATPQPGVVAGTNQMKRDILWIECKAPILNFPAGWHDALTEATDRLAGAHPNRMLYLILAIGAQWLPFVWDPTTPPLPAAQRLTFLNHDGTTWNDVHPSIRPMNLPMIPAPNLALPRDQQQCSSPARAILNHWSKDFVLFLFPLLLSYRIVLERRKSPILN